MNTAFEFKVGVDENYQWPDGRICPATGSYFAARGKNGEIELLDGDLRAVSCSLWQVRQEHAPLGCGNPLVYEIGSAGKWRLWWRWVCLPRLPTWWGAT